MKFQLFIITRMLQTKDFSCCTSSSMELNTFFVDHFCYLCLVFVMHSRLFIAALWSPAGKELTSWLLFVMFNCIFVAFQCSILGQVWYLIEKISDLCRIFYLDSLQPPVNYFTDVQRRYFFCRSFVFLLLFFCVLCFS